MQEADVVVVGAGLAGLAAARALTKGGASVVVVEARGRVGGRVENHDIGDGKVVEVGGQWIGPTQDRLAALARELGVDTFPTNAAGENLIEYEGSVRRFRGTIPRINPAVLVDVQQAQMRLNRLARRVPLHAPWEAPNAAKLDEQTAATWMRRNIRTKSGRMLLGLGIEAVWAAQPEDMSLLHVLFYIHSAGSLERLFDTEGGAQQDRFVGGSQLVPLRMAEALGEDRIVLSSPVRRIEHGADGVTVHGEEPVARGRRAILAIAPTLAGRLRYDPPLPGYRDQLTQRVPMGAVIKCFAVYDEPFWRTEGLSGSTVSGSGPLTLTIDNSPPSGSPGILVGFLEGDHARSFGRTSPEERREAVIANLVQLFGTRAGKVEQFIEKSWAEEEWSRGCYEGYTPPGVLTAFGPALREPIGPIHWAGTETATKWNGYIDGALQSGERAAREALAELSVAKAAAVS